jgi:hypothetical protein
VKGLAWQDEAAHFVFAPTFLGINVEIENRTVMPIRIHWTKSAYVDYLGKSDTVMHEGVKYIDRNTTNIAPSTILGGAYLKDVIIPASAIELVNGKWSINPILPVLIDPAKLPGFTFSVLLSVETGGVRKDYAFDFLLDTVTTSDGTTYRRTIPDFGFKKPPAK